MALEGFKDSINNDKLDFYDGRLNGQKLKQLNENVDKEIALAEIIKNAKLEENEQAKDIISNLDASKLSSLIEKNFKKENRWSNYSHMRNDPFYFFYVKAAIDHLSDKLVDQDGKELKFEFNGKEGTLDEHLNDLGGIDDRYSRNLVKLAQKAMGINEKHCDGLAGPQFFAKICAFLNGSGGVVSSDDFVVEGIEKGKYKYGFDSNTYTFKDQGTDGSEGKEISIVCPNGITLADEVGGKRYIKINGSKSIFYIDDKGQVQNDKGTSYYEKLDGKITLEGNIIKYTKPEFQNNNALEKAFVDKYKLTDINENPENIYKNYPIDKSKKIYQGTETVGPGVQCTYYYYVDGDSLKGFPVLYDGITSLPPTPLMITYNGLDGKRTDSCDLETKSEYVFLTNWLNGCLKKGLQNYKISIDNKNVVFKDGKYYVNSFGHKTQIKTKAYTDGDVFNYPYGSSGWGKKNFLNELKFLNFINRLKSGCDGKLAKDIVVGDTFHYETNGYLYLQKATGTNRYDGKYLNVLKNDTFKKFYGDLTQGEGNNLCHLLNSEIPNRKN